MVPEVHIPRSDSEGMGEDVMNAQLPTFKVPLQFHVTDSYTRTLICLINKKLFMYMVKNFCTGDF